MPQAKSLAEGAFKPKIKIQLDSAWRQDMAAADVVGGKIQRIGADHEMNALEVKVISEANVSRADEMTKQAEAL